MRDDLTAAALTATALLAAATSYDRVFSSTAWRAPVVAAAAVATLVVLLARLLGRGAPTASIVTVVAYVAFVPWFVGLADTPVLPTPSVLAELIGSARAGWVDMVAEPAPAPVTQGLATITVTGWWFVAHAANALLVCARRGGPGLVVLATLWAVPLAFPNEDAGLAVGSTTAGTVVFLAAGAMILLLTTHRGGRVVSGAVVGVAVIGVAVLSPWLLPDHSQDAWLSVAGSSSPRGYQPIVDVTTRLNEPQARDLLQVRASTPSYLRLAGLDHFDGSVWRLGDTTQGPYRPARSSLTAATSLLPPEVPATRTEMVEVDVTVLELENVYVPVPYQPVEVLGPLRDELVWSTEGGFLTSLGSVASGGPDQPAIILPGTEYRVRAARPTPRVEDLESVALDDATVEEFTQLPREYPELAELARRVYDEAGATSTVERAIALQNWFVEDDRFTYDLDVPALRGDEALTRFVLDDRIGYCEYFASAMAVMLRESGIPARVAVGFLPGREVTPASADGGFAEYVVATTDAHAWVEVLFPGYGWVTFEPTPRSDEAEIRPQVDNLAPTRTERERRVEEFLQSGADGDPSSPEPLEPQIEAPTPDGDGDLAGEDPTSTGTEDDGRRSFVWWTAALVVLTLGVGARLLAVRRAATGDRDPRRRVLAAQHELFTAARTFGAARRRHETTAELLQRWDRQGRTTSAARLARALQDAAFGGSLDTQDADRLESGVGVAIDELRASGTSPQRVFAPLRRFVVMLDDSQPVRWLSRRIAHGASRRSGDR